MQTNIQSTKNELILFEMLISNVCGEDEKF